MDVRIIEMMNEGSIVQKVRKTTVKFDSYRSNTSQYCNGFHILIGLALRLNCRFCFRVKI